jgi:hypothetical protein
LFLRMVRSFFVCNWRSVRLITATTMWIHCITPNIRVLCSNNTFLSWCWQIRRREHIVLIDILFLCTEYCWCCKVSCYCNLRIWTSGRVLWTHSAQLPKTGECLEFLRNCQLLKKAALRCT